MSIRDDPKQFQVKSKSDKLEHVFAMQYGFAIPVDTRNSSLHSHMVVSSVAFPAFSRSIFSPDRKTLHIYIYIYMRANMPRYSVSSATLRSAFSCMRFPMLFQVADCTTSSPGAHTFVDRVCMQLQVQSQRTFAAHACAV